MKKRISISQRILDRYLGISLIALLRLFKRKRRFNRQKINSIAILNTAAIGDTILILAIIKDLQLAFPRVKITFFAGSSNISAIRLDPTIKSIEIPIKNPLKSLRIMRRQHFDLWIDCGQWARINALLSFFAKHAYSIGFQTKEQYRHYIYDQSVIHNPQLHELENFRNLIRSIDIKVQNLPTLPKKNFLKKPYVTLHLFAGGSRAELKQWNLLKWVQVIDYLTKQKITIHLTGSQKDYRACQNVIKLCQNKDFIVNQAGAMCLSQTADLLQQCLAVISVDTGIGHLAAALDCPVIAIHGPTAPQRWGAVGKKVKFVTPAKPYNPCINMGFEKRCSQNTCMESIQAEDVINSFEQLIDRFL